MAVLELSFTRQQVLKGLIYLMFAVWVVSIGGLIQTTNMARRKELYPGHPTFNLANDNFAREYIIVGHLQSFPQPGLDDDNGQNPGICAPNTLDTMPGQGIGLLGLGRGGCYPSGSQLPYRVGIHFSFEFWSMALEFFCIVFAYLAVTRPFFNSKHTLICLIAIATFQYTIFASVYMKMSYQFHPRSIFPTDKAEDGTKTALGGAIGVLIMNYVFMFAYGSEYGIEDDLEAEAAKLETGPGGEEKTIDPLQAAKDAASATKNEFKKVSTGVH